MSKTGKSGKSASFLEKLKQRADKNPKDKKTRLPPPSFLGKYRGKAGAINPKKSLAFDYSIMCQRGKGVSLVVDESADIEVYGPLLDDMTEEGKALARALAAKDLRSVGELASLVASQIEPGSKIYLPLGKLQYTRKEIRSLMENELKPLLDAVLMGCER